MKRTFLLLVFLTGAMALAGCSSNNADDEHALQAYEDALERARDVEADVQEAFDRQREAIEEN
jgi:hypothetical protein